MKLDKALELGEECGLGTVREAIFNVETHAPSLFAVNEIDDEIIELLTEWQDLKLSDAEFPYNNDSSIREVLEWIRERSLYL
ncbi:MAG: hypothetical protein J6B01_04830 [Ruminococcus sp.]|nr:hypothetical protein [Ruminococcus sp.]MBO5319117.1 hypothetical protein [Ruminococcus sp.]